MLALLVGLSAFSGRPPLPLQPPRSAAPHVSMTVDGGGGLPIPARIALILGASTALTVAAFSTAVPVEDLLSDSKYAFVVGGPGALVAGNVLNCFKPASAFRNGIENDMFVGLLGGPEAVQEYFGTGK